MTIERLREVHQARPFRPFRLHLADGRGITVTHPESLAYDARGRTIVVVLSTGATHFVDLLLVTDIEIDGRGARGRKKGS